MLTFRYVAKDQDGRSVSGKITADAENVVIDELRKRRLIIISVKEEKTGSKISFGGKKVKPDEIVIFARQLATMVEAGIPILQALDAWQEQMTQPYFKTVIANMRDDIQLGSSLSAAFA